MPDLIEGPPEYPESVLLSIYNAYPRRTGRPQAIRRIHEALNRICQGEIDGAERTQAEAIEFLRLKVEEARRQMGAREQKFIPHMATWLHQRRYLRPELAFVPLQPARLSTCMEILLEYPTMLAVKHVDPEVYAPALNAIDKALEIMEYRVASRILAHKQLHAARRLKSRTELYAMAVKQWPVEDLKFVPNPVKWYGECRYDQPSESWVRQPNNGFSQEREQIKRILSGSHQTGGGGGLPN